MDEDRKKEIEKFRWIINFPRNTNLYYEILYHCIRTQTKSRLILQTFVHQIRIEMELTSLMIYIGIFITLFLLAILISDGDLTLMFAERFGKRLSKCYYLLSKLISFLSVFLCEQTQARWKDKSIGLSELHLELANT